MDEDIRTEIYRILTDLICDDQPADVCIPFIYDRIRNAVLQEAARAIRGVSRPAYTPALARRAEGVDEATSAVLALRVEIADEYGVETVT